MVVDLLHTAPMRVDRKHPFGESPHNSVLDMRSHLQVSVSRERECWRDRRVRVRIPELNVVLPVFDFNWLELRIGSRQPPSSQPFPANAFSPKE